MSIKKTEEGQTELASGLTLDEANKALKAVKTAMKKTYGEDTFREKSREPLESISTGSAVIDMEIGNGGLTCGRVHEIFGSSGSGKSSLCTIVCANAMNKYPNKHVFYFDFEQAFHIDYAASLGLDVDDERFNFLQPTSADEGFDIALNVIKTGAVSLVVFDSVPAMLTKRELERGFDEETMAEKARFLSKSIPKLLEVIRQTGTVVLFVNQVRDKLSYMGGTTTPGGKALPFYCTTRLELSRTQVLTDKDIAIGQTIKCYVRKNKVGRPFGVLETNLIFWEGFDYVSEMFDVAKKLGIISGGAWVTLPEGHVDGKLNGKNAVVEFYRNNNDKFEDLVNIVKNYSPNKEIEKSIPNEKIDEEDSY